MTTSAACMKTAGKWIALEESEEYSDTAISRLRIFLPPLFNEYPAELSPPEKVTESGQQAQDTSPQPHNVSDVVPSATTAGEQLRTTRTDSDVSVTLPQVDESFAANPRDITMSEQVSIEPAELENLYHAGSIDNPSDPPSPTIMSEFTSSGKEDDHQHLNRQIQLTTRTSE